jgi:hypothetical protein
MMDKIRLRATITIEIEADDFTDAAIHQKRLTAAVDKLSETYSGIKLSLRERRDRRPRETEAKPLGVTTGRMHRYA